MVIPVVDPVLPYRRGMRSVQGFVTIADAAAPDVAGVID
jgi:hypothetical protein